MNRQAGRVTEKRMIGEVEGHARREKERVRERETREVDGRTGCGWLQLITDHHTYIHGFERTDTVNWCLVVRCT